MEKIRIDLGYSDKLGVLFKLMPLREFAKLYGIEYMSDSHILNYAELNNFVIVHEHSRAVEREEMVKQVIEKFKLFGKNHSWSRTEVSILRAYDLLPPRPERK